MKTKSLLCAAALATGLATSALGQSNIYSENVVGFYNVNVPAFQFVLIGNQLDRPNNTLTDIIPSPPKGSQFQSFQNGGFIVQTFDEFDLTWLPNPNFPFKPGQGGYFRSPKNTTLTFLGEVKQGPLINSLINGQFVIAASIVPIATNIVGMGVPGEPGDQVQIYSGGLTAYTFDEFDLAWTPGNPNGPAIAIGQSFFYRKSPTAANTNWVVNFTVQ